MSRLVTYHDQCNECIFRWVHVDKAIFFLGTNIYKKMT